MWGKAGKPGVLDQGSFRNGHGDKMQAKFRMANRPQRKYKIAHLVGFLSNGSLHQYTRRTVRETTAWISVLLYIHRILAFSLGHIGIVAIVLRRQHYWSFFLKGSQRILSSYLSKAPPPKQCLHWPPQPLKQVRRHRRHGHQSPPTPRLARRPRTRRPRRCWRPGRKKAIRISMKRHSFSSRLRVRPSAPRAGGFGGYCGLSLRSLYSPSSSRAGSMPTMSK